MAGVLELVYKTDLKSVARKGLRVQISPPAPSPNFKWELRSPKHSLIGNIIWITGRR